MYASLQHSPRAQRLGRSEHLKQKAHPHKRKLLQNCCGEAGTTVHRSTFSYNLYETPLRLPKNCELYQMWVPTPHLYAHNTDYATLTIRSCIFMLEIPKILSRRIGSFLAGSLAGIVALTPDQHSSVEVGATMVALVAIDVILSAMKGRWT